MPRARNPNRDKAKQIYLDHKGDIDLIQIAKELKTPPGTIRGWKNKDKWNSELNGTFPKDTERSKRKVKNSPPSKEPKLQEELKQLENANLTDKQRLFCIYYVKYRNATKAYRKAYKCSYNAAMPNGSRLLSNDKVKTEVEKLKRAQLKQAWFDKEDLIQKHIDIALADITDYVQFGTKKHIVNPKAVKEGADPIYIDYSYVDIHGSDVVDGSLISEISQGKNGIKIKLLDKKQSLDFLSCFTGFIDPAVNKRLEIEREKLELLKRKESDEGDGNEDDGFMEALQASVKDVWADEE